MLLCLQTLLNGTVREAELSATETSLNLTEPCNAKLVTIGTQTFEDSKFDAGLPLQQLKDDLAPQVMLPTAAAPVAHMPASQSNPNLYALYHGAWPIDKGKQHV